MGIVVGFAPYIAFFVLQSHIGTPLALAIGAAIALALVLRSRSKPNEPVSILEIGTAVILGALAVFTFATNSPMPLLAAQLAVKAGLFVIAVISLAIGQPFTLAYARKQIDPAYWSGRQFIRANYVITSAWAAAFVIAALVDAILIWKPVVPELVGAALASCSFIGAMAFTLWYAKRAKAAPDTN